MRAKLIGMNHIAREVGDVEEAIEFYGARSGGRRP
jgi:hypothetical protein